MLFIFVQLFICLLIKITVYFISLYVDGYACFDEDVRKEHKN